jgi:hypothetical protein
MSVSHGAASTPLPPALGQKRASARVHQSTCCGPIRAHAAAWQKIAQEDQTSRTYRRSAVMAASLLVASSSLTPEPS